jgi:hypothetical protein
MDKSAERALKAYPVKIAGRDGYDENLRERKGFVKGYHQAEKDKELTWEDIKTIDKLLNQCVDYGNPYQEVLKRFKDLKK